MSEMRRPGWYWVRKTGCDWQPAEWAITTVGDCHYVSWDSELADTGLDADFEEIGPRIPTPDEPWQTVPVNPTREMMNATPLTYAPNAVWRDMLAAAPSLESPK